MDPATNTTSETPSVVLCLSGGGFRATFFHLGVIRFLAKTGWLKKITHVFSVSGGSILAAHMALNWDAYASPLDSEFERVAGEIMRFGQSDVRGRILRLWIPFVLGRTQLFERCLDALYKNAQLDQLPEAPKFHFLATSLTSGQLCAFDKKQWMAIGAEGGGLNFAGIKSGYLKLSRVVAASAAFPPMFPPVRIRATGLGIEEARFEPTHYLADGGIFDNLGVAEIFHLVDSLGLSPEELTRPIMTGGFTRSPIDPRPPQRPSHAIVSDASASFDQATKGGFASIVSRTSRATDILMARLARRDIASLGQAMRDRNPDHNRLNRFVHLSIRHTPRSFETKPGARYETQSTTVQHGIRYVRTDLDRFDSKLIWYLMRHGYDAAAHVMRRYLATGVEIEELKPIENSPVDIRMEDEERLQQFMQSQKGRFRKDNLFGLLSLPYGALATLIVLAIALKIACGLL